MSNLVRAGAAAILLGAIMPAQALAAAETSPSRAAASPSASRAQLLQGLKPVEEMDVHMKTLASIILGPLIGTVIGSAIGDPANADEDAETSRMELRKAKAVAEKLDSTLAKLKTGFAAAEVRVGSSGGEVAVDAMRASGRRLRGQIADAIKNLDDGTLTGDDLKKLTALFEKMEDQADDVRKSRDETEDAVIRKID